MTVTAPRVLVADDSADLRAVIGSLLERAGISVAGEAADGAAALGEATRLEVDVVVLDAAMPGADPKAVVDGLRSLQPAPAVVVYSGWPAAELAALDVPVVAKSADPGQLVAAVQLAAGARADG